MLAQIAKTDPYIQRCQVGGAGGLGGAGGIAGPTLITKHIRKAVAEFQGKVADIANKRIQRHSGTKERQTPCKQSEQ